MKTVLIVPNDAATSVPPSVVERALQRLRRIGVLTALPLICAGAMATPTTAAEVAACEPTAAIVNVRLPLSQLLQRMSGQMGFRLAYQATDDPIAIYEGGRSVVDAMRAIARQADMMVVYRDDARCAGRLRVDAVWVFPSGTARERPPAPRFDVPMGAPPNPHVLEFARMHGAAPKDSPTSPTK